MDTFFNHPVTLAVAIVLPLFGILAKLFGATFERIAKWYLYISVFAVVVVMNSIFFPFIGGKDYFFRFTVELSLIFFILWWAFEARAGELKELIRTNYKKPMVKAVTIFVVIFLLACIFAVDVHAAFWSNFERGEGGFQMIHYYLFFILLVFLMKREEDWKNIFKFSLVAAALMIGYGVLANYSVNGFIGPYAGTTVPPGWWHQLVDGRFEGSLGNPAYVAPYLIFSMFYAAYLWVKRKRGEISNALAHIGWGVLMAVFLFFFILTQTRGALIGLVLGVVALLLYWAISVGGNVRKWSLVTLGILIVLGGIGFAFRNSAFVQKIPEGRLLQISLSDYTAQTRFWVWGEAWKGFLERPILGWGPENFTAVFDKYFDPRFFVPGQNTETWFDRAHSVFFDYLTETGIFGLLSYLSIFFAFYWGFFKKKKTNEAAGTHSMALERGLVIAVPIAYLVQGVAIFDVLPMYLNLFLFMAFATYYFSSRESRPNAISHESQ